MYNNNLIRVLGYDKDPAEKEEKKNGGNWLSWLGNIFNGNKALVGVAVGGLLLVLLLRRK